MKFILDLIQLSFGTSSLLCVIVVVKTRNSTKNEKLFILGIAALFAIVSFMAFSLKGIIK